MHELSFAASSLARLPYVELPELPLLPGRSLTLKPVGTLWVLGLGAAAFVSYRECRRRNLDRERLSSLLIWMMTGAFLVGHWFDLLVYSPELLALEPASWLDVWRNQSSFGGLLGALIGTLLWRWRSATPALPYADAIASSFPLGLGVGRLGCAVAHDHPGRATDSIWAVAFPEGPRFDLGLLEALVLLVLSVAFAALRRANPRTGSFLGIACVAYAVLRFGLDFLRVGDARYGGLTPAQWLSPALCAMGIAVLKRRAEAPAVRFLP